MTLTHEDPMESTRRIARWPLTKRIAVGALVLLTLIAVGIGIASAAEIIPSVGITRPVDDNVTSDAKIYGGLAVRGALLPFLKGEIGAAYRSESRLDGNLKVRQWPITTSLWLAPAPWLYAGGGVGWYQTTYDFNSALPFQDDTQQQFGVHVGGGVEVPVAPAAALDLNGRYVFIRNQENPIPQDFNPNFWTTTLGLAIKF
jgi:Outer membrane protein beta-barrel domain